MQVKLWYLDNEHLDYIVMAETRDEAWAKLRNQAGILPPYEDTGVMSGEDDAGLEEDGLDNAYNDIYEVTAETKVDNPNDLEFVL